MPVFMGSNTCTLEVRAPEQGSVEAARVDEERKVLEMMQKVEPFHGSLPRYFFLNRVGIEQGMTYDYFGSEMVGWWWVARASVAVCAISGAVAHPSIDAQLIQRSVAAIERPHAAARRLRVGGRVDAIEPHLQPLVPRHGPPA